MKSLHRIRQTEDPNHRFKKWERPTSPDTTFRADGPVTPQNALQFQALIGNRATRKLVERQRHTSTLSPALQRDFLPTYEASIGAEEPIPDYTDTRQKEYREMMGKPIIGDDMSKAKPAHAIQANEAKIRAMLNTVFQGVITEPQPGVFQLVQQTMTPAQLVDQLFQNTLAYHDGNINYDTGGAGRGPDLILSGSGHCGMLASNFINVVNTASALLNINGLKAASEGLNYDYVTDAFNTLPGNPNHLAGANQSEGNVYKEFQNNQVTTGYSNILRAKFKYHSWAVVTLPGGAKWRYDLLLKFKTQNYPNMTNNQVGGNQYEVETLPNAPAMTGFVTSYALIHKDASYNAFLGQKTALENALQATPKLSQWAIELKHGTFRRRIREDSKRANAVQRIKGVAGQIGRYTSYKHGLLKAQGAGHLRPIWKVIRKVTKDY